LRFTTGIILSLFMASVAFAHDPGIPDTIIVGTVYTEIGRPYADIPVFAVTDDSVAFYNLPVIWSSNPEESWPIDVFYYHFLAGWDTFDSLLVEQEFMRMLGWAPLTDYLQTEGHRLHCWDIRFAIDSMAQPQIITVDTGIDPINGTILFGLAGGLDEFIPQFVPGAIYYGIPTRMDGDEPVLPLEMAYLQNYPNPFNVSTTIEFALPGAADIELAVYNILGQKIAVLFDGRKPASEHSITWNAGNLPSGIYFARLKTTGLHKDIKMVLLK
jgi:hypothetical protein